MIRPPAGELLDVRSVAGVQTVLLPSVVRGQLRMPAAPRVGDLRRAVAAHAHVTLGPTDQGTLLVVRPVIDRATLAPTGETQVLVLSAPDPGELREPDPAAAIEELLAMPHGEVCDFVDAVGDALRTHAGGTADASALLAATSQVSDRAHRAFAEQMPDLFDGAAVRRMVEGDLGRDGLAALDAWTAVDASAVAGAGARMAEKSAGLGPAPLGGGGSAPAPLRVRAVPTRQLHLTAGNAPVVPVASLLWAWATKGASVLKPAAEAAVVVAAIGAALMSVDPRHPLTRHTTLAYWRGGDVAVESVLLADGAFDRRVVWGSEETIESVTRRGGTTDTIVLRPRQAVSLVGRAALHDDLRETVRLAAVDSLVANQQACMSSLLHVVEGDGTDVDDYARALADVLAAWDTALPHRPSRAVQGRLVALRRGRLAAGRWHVNGQWPDVTSAVVTAPGSFDLAHHPGGRLVVVRATPTLDEALPVLGPAVANVGVAPEKSRLGLRDRIAARGVDNVLPLGAAEQGYAGRPHDGMRVLSRLVRWVNA